MGNAEQKNPGESDSFVDELQAGTELLHGQYKIDRFLNSGGFGITYMARDSLDRKVVIKECFPSSFCHRSRAIVEARSRAHTKELKSIVSLFVQEAHSLAKMNHPNIVGVHQVFEENQTAYMVLDFVEGRDLLDILEDPEHTLTAPQIKGILKDVLGAVKFIHEQEILHRDISPDNILVDPDLRPVLIDFGAAREQASKQSRVLSAMRVVKDGYSPQEFYIQGSAQSPSSDLYALGASFYHLIDGKIPPNSQARLASIASGEKDPYEPLADRIKGFDKPMLAAIDKAMGILPKDRIQSAQDWLDMMETGRRRSRVLTKPVPVSSAAAATQAQARKSGMMVPLLGTAAAIAVLAVGGYFAVGMRDQFALPADTFMPTGPTETAQTEANSPEVVATLEEEVAELPIFDNLPEVAQIPEALVDAIEAGATATSEADEIVIDVDAEIAAALTGAQPAQDTVSFEDSAEVTSTPVLREHAEFKPEPIDPIANAPVLDVATAAPETTIRPAPRDDLAAQTIISDETADIAASETKANPNPLDSTPADVVAEAPAAPIFDETPPSINAVAPALAAAPDAGLLPVVPASLDPDLPRFENAGEQSSLTSTTIESPLLLGREVIFAPEPTPLPPVVSNLDVDEITGVLSAWLVDLPFEAEGQGNVIGDVAPGAPSWAKSGTKIIAVNSQPISRISDINPLLRSRADPGDAQSLKVSFATGRNADGTLIENIVDLPVVQDTVLLNGIKFRSQAENGVWKTTVIEVPEGSSGDFLVGDVLVAEMSNSTKFEGRMTLTDMLSDEIKKGTTQFSFAVNREGSMWITSLTYAGGL